jgi:hypothetical protein
LLGFLFAPENPSRNLFIGLFLVNVLTITLAVAYWFKISTAGRWGSVLALTSIGLLAWALWFADALWILSYALGSVLSIWSWSRGGKSSVQKGNP